MIRIVWVAAACLLLAACSTPARRAFPRHYTLTVVTAQPASGHAVRAPRATLQIARIRAPAWLQDTGMYYRLAYWHDHAIAAYAQSDWAAPPAMLLEPVLAAALAGGGGWRAVIGPGTPAQTDYALQIRLDEFSQVFSSPAESEGVLDATATLVDARADGVIAQTDFHLRVAAPSADAAGGALALNHASHEFATRVQAWLESMRLPPTQPCNRQTVTCVVAVQHKTD